MIQTGEAATLLDHLQAETRAAQKYSAQLREETTRATEKQLQDRKSAFQAVEAEHKAVLKPLQIKINNFKTAIDGLQRRQIELQTEIKGLEANIMARRKIESDLERRNSAVIIAIADAKDVKSVVEAQIEALHLEIAPLQDNIRELTAEVDGFLVKRDKLRVEIEDAITDLETTQAQKRRMVAILDAKANDLAINNEQLQHDMELERDELARRIKAANERDKVLTQREAKARRDEAVNMRNSQLMNL